MDNERRLAQGAKGEKPSLHESHISNVLSGIANHEGKLALLLMMEPGEVYGWRKLQKLLGQDGKRNPFGNMVAYAWCRDSISLTNFIANGETTNNKGGYTITPEGEALGVPLAGQLLAFSEAHPEVALSQFIGTTSSTGKTRIIETDNKETPVKTRAPFIRFSIMSELVSASLPVRVSDIVKNLSDTYPEYTSSFTIPSVSNHLATLRSIDCISFDSSPAGAFVFYTPTGEEVPQSTAFRYPTLIADIMSIVPSNDKRLSADDIYNRLVHLDERYESRQSGELRSSISRTLVQLANEGVFTREEEVPVDARTSISLSDSQKATMQEFVTLINTFQSRDSDFLAEGQEKAQALLADPARLSALMEKAYANSVIAQRISAAETERRILQIVLDRPGLTFSEIQSELIVRYNQKVSIAAIRQRSTDLYSSKVNNDNRLRIYPNSITIFSSE